MQAFDKLPVSQGAEDSGSHAGHDTHAGDNIGRVRELDANLGKGRADGSHAIGDDVHGAACGRRQAGEQGGGGDVEGKQGGEAQMDGCAGRQEGAFSRELDGWMEHVAYSMGDIPNSRTLERILPEQRLSDGFARQPLVQTLVTTIPQLPLQIGGGKSFPTGVGIIPPPGLKVNYLRQCLLGNLFLSKR